MANAVIVAQISLSGRIRQWLMENPGWHFASDVHEAMGARTAKARQSISALLANQAALGMVARKGEKRLYRYAANSTTARVCGHVKSFRRLSALEEAFEHESQIHGSADRVREFIELVRRRASDIAALRLEGVPHA